MYMCMWGYQSPLTVPPALLWPAYDLQLTWLQYPKYRLWRKNASPLNDTECAGVDLNRNFDVGWGTV